MKSFTLTTSFSVLFIVSAYAQATVSVKNAVKHIGQTVSVCDKVIDEKLVLPANNILLNIGSDNPAQMLTMMIRAADRDKFKGKPEIDYRGKDIIVTGKVVLYKGIPEIVVSDPNHLKLVLVDNPKNPVLR
jgi:DNA/RNA endonuclease YhcR with UshA esterase domain